MRGARFVSHTRAPIFLLEIRLPSRYLRTELTNCERSYERERLISSRENWIHKSCWIKSIIFGYFITDAKRWTNIIDTSRTSRIYWFRRVLVLRRIIRYKKLVVSGKHVNPNTTRLLESHNRRLVKIFQTWWLYTMNIRVNFKLSHSECLLISLGRWISSKTLDWVFWPYNPAILVADKEYTLQSLHSSAPAGVRLLLSKLTLGYRWI